MEAGDYDPLDPERHLKRINNIFGVSSKIQNLVLQKRSLPVLVSKEDKFEATLVWKFFEFLQYSLIFL